MRHRPALFLLQVYLAALVPSAWTQNRIVRNVGRLQEVFAWKQITYNIQGNMLLEDRFGDDFEDAEGTRERRQAENVFFDNEDRVPDRNWSSQNRSRPTKNNRPSWQGQSSWGQRPTISTRRPATTASPDSPNSFFIQYNNVPMGVERVDNRVFVTVPRRRYGIPATLNYLDLTQDSSTRSPGLRPYPSLRQSRALTSVYRTRADECGRLWMVDTGLMEIPNNRQQVQPPAIVVYDLSTDRQILRYPFKSTDIPAATTPTGLASITVDITNGECGGAFAYVPDLTTYGLIVYSLRDNDSWRLSHNYFSFTPTAGNLNIAGQRFQWSDGVFSVALTSPGANGCRTAYFHAMVGTQEFSVSTCVLRNRTASADSNYWSLYSIVGDRGADGQCTMHAFHPGSQVVFFADIARDAVSCWNTGTALSPATVGILARDSVKLSYPSDLHVSGDEVWVMANTLPRFGYSRLDTSEYNFYVYKANVKDLISGTVCAA